MPTIAASLPDITDYMAGDGTNRFKYLPAQVIDLAAGIVTLLYNSGPAKNAADQSDVGPTERVCDSILIRNCGVVAVKYAFDNKVTVGVFHDLLGPDTGVDAGYGGTIVVFPRRDSIISIWAMAIGGAGRVCMSKRAAWGDIVE